MPSALGARRPTFRTAKAHHVQISAPRARGRRRVGVRARRAGRSARPPPASSASSASSASTNPPALPAGDGTPPPDSKTLNAVVVSAKRLDEARNKLSPETGSSVYRFDKEDIAALPQGDNTALNRVLLQARGHTGTPSGNCMCAATMPTCNTASTASSSPSRSAASARCWTRALPTSQPDHGRTASPVRLPYCRHHRHPDQGRRRRRGTKTPPKPFGGEIGTVIGSHGDREVNAQVQGTAGRSATT